MPTKTKPYTVEVSMYVRRTYNVDEANLKAAQQAARDRIYHEVMIDDADISWDYDVQDLTRSSQAAPWE